MTKKISKKQEQALKYPVSDLPIGYFKTTPNPLVFLDNYKRVWFLEMNEKTKEHYLKQLSEVPRKREQGSQWGGK